MKTKSLQKPQVSKKTKFTKETHSELTSLVKTDMLGVGVTNDTKKNILEFIVESIENSRENYYITTPNPEMIVAASHSLEARVALNKAKIALCDGVGLFLAGQLLGKPFKERFTGVELVESLCEKVKDRPITVGFLGGGPKIAESASDCLSQEYPGLRVVLATEEWGSVKANSMRKDFHSLQAQGPKREKNETHNIIGQEEISSEKDTPVDILFVGFGFPKQELWMASHIDKIPVRVMVGVGGALDFLSGNVKRAPKWVQKIGMEWLFRLILQPWRIKRQLALPQFVWMVLKERFK